MSRTRVLVASLVLSAAGFAGWIASEGDGLHGPHCTMTIEKVVPAASGGAIRRT